MAAYKLFKKDISPACEYCEFGSNTVDGMVECQKSGIVSPYFQCVRFKYSPVRRVPRQPSKPLQQKPENTAL